MPNGKTIAPKRIVVPSEQMDDDALKADYIAKKGVTRVPRADRSTPLAAIVSAPPEVTPENQETSAAPPPVARNMRDFGAKPVLMWVPTSDLHINMAYQRNVSTKRGQSVIKDIVNNFQWPLFQPVTITQREEAGYWVIDGQHRMIAAKQLGIREIPAVLLDGLSQVQQALAFAGINGKRVSVNAYAIHHAMVAAEDPISARLAKVCELADIIIPRYPKMSVVMKPNETLAIAAMKAAMKAYGDDALIWALRLLRSIYPDEAGAITANAVRVLSAFYSAYADFPIHVETLEKVLTDKDVEELREDAVRSAATTPERTRWIIAALADIYNAALPTGKTPLTTAAHPVKQSGAVGEEAKWAKRKP